MLKNSDQDNTISITRLRYKKGDLIIKEGDFGLSIYRVVEGKVMIFTETEDIVIPLATLGPGGVLGEMVFLNKKIERRSASARAITDSLLEIWHPKMLDMEYKQMPTIIKYLADQTLDRLIRMNKLIVKYIEKKNKRIKDQEHKDPWAAKRRYYRKLVNIPFDFRPANATAKEKTSGEMKDISLSGAGLEVKNIGKVFPYRPGDEFVISANLPNGKEIELPAEIVTIKPGESGDSIFLGVSFTNLSEIAAKNLGFFLMP
jgi:hypothetical protein